MLLKNSLLKSKRTNENTDLLITLLSVYDFFVFWYM